MVINIFWGICIINLIAVLSGYLELELLEKINDGEFISEEEANMNDLRQGIVGILQSIFYISSIVTFLGCFRRAYGNLYRLGAKPTYNENMATWSFFIPFVNLVRPYKISKEILNFSGQKLLELDSVTRFSSSAGILGICWALFLITNWIGNIAFKMVLRGGDSLTDLISQNQVYLLSDTLDIPAAFVTLLMIKKIKIIESALYKKVFLNR